MHKLVFILGKVGAGKDTLVNIFKSEYQFEPFFYADNLKAVLMYAGWDNEKNLRGRKLLQDVGYAFRKYDENFWVDWVFEDIESYIESYEEGKLPNNEARIIIGDVRHPNEISRLLELFNKKYGWNKSVTIKIKGPNRDGNREMDQETLADVSETSMDNYQPDYLIINDLATDIEELRSFARAIFEAEFSN
jgi:hypothetical protein